MIKFFKKRYLTFTANYTGLNDESGGAMSKNKKARVVSFKGAGHIANLDKPDEFNQVLLKIVTELYINKEK